jgi:hypothetical protein
MKPAPERQAGNSMNHYPMPIPEHYSPAQVLAILELLETLHNAIREVYALPLRDFARAERARFANDDEDLDIDPDISF